MADEQILLRPATGEGISSITYDGKGNIVTAGESTVVYVFKSTTDEDARAIEENTGPVTSTACKNMKLLTACEDHHVRLFDLSRAENCFEAVVTRFQAPVRAVALNATGSACASGGDDMVIKLVTFVDMSVRELVGSEGPIRSLCFDPQMELLASSSEDGYLRLWSLSNARIVQETFVLPAVRGGADPAEHGMYGIDFDPKGMSLAVPVKNNIHIFDRALEFQFALKDLGHEAPVSSCKWSPDGRYLASVSVDGQILIWEASTRQSVSSFRHPRGLCITSIAWHPHEDELAYSDFLGNFSVWKKPVRDSVKEKLSAEELLQIEEEKRDAKSRAEVSALFDKEDEPQTRVKVKRPMTNRNRIVDSDDENEEDFDIETSAIDDFIVDDTADQAYSSGAAVAQFIQPPFQPASTPLEEPKRFLVWNDAGFILSREEETTSAIDIEFHNASKHRPIRLVDHFGFTMGALTPQLVALAALSHAPTEDDPRDHPSVLFVRNIGHWSTDESWQLFFPEGEEIECVAVGNGDVSFVAAATSKRYVRIFSNNGVAQHVICLDGPVVTMAAHNTKLMIIYHRGLGVNGNQNMGVHLLDIEKKTTICKTGVLLSEGSLLTWAGFSDNGLPAIVDSEEVLRALVSDWGYSWTPLAELKRLKDEKHKTDSYWVTGVSDNELVCIICRGGESYPKVLPRPIVSTVPLQMPIVSLPETALLEEKFIRSKIFAEHLIEHEGLDELDKTDRKLIQYHRRQLDQHLLACISRSVQSQRWGRALDLTARLALPSSYDLAIKLAMKSNSPMLAERMSLAKQALQAAEKDRIRERLQQSQAAVAQHSSPTLVSPQQMRAPHRPTFDESPSKLSVSKMEVEQDEEQEQQRRNDGNHTGSKAATTKQKSSDPFSNAFNKSSTSSRPARTEAAKTKLSNPFSKKRAPAEEESVSSTSNPIDALNDLARTSPKKAKATPPKTTPKASEAKEKVQPSLSTVTKQAPAKKAASGYMAWLKENRQAIIDQFPGMQPKEVVKKAGELWRALSAEEKKKYSASNESSKQTTENGDAHGSSTIEDDTQTIDEDKTKHVASAHETDDEDLDV
eukprot:m.189568 g.189568  ORF g.189568 m.189568 type:complete len:1080 (+) comp16746_c1_seq1:144-3383(+)